MNNFADINLMVVLHRKIKKHVKIHLLISMKSDH